MKMPTSTLTLAITLYALSAWAQHGQGMGPAAGPAMHNMGSGRHASSMAESPTARGMTPSQQLARNTRLAGKIQALTGMPAQQACSGFKNLGQCVAAAHVSKNLGITFACLRSDMTAQAPLQGASCPSGTGSKSMSLGKAIQTLRPSADHALEAKKGRREADQDLKETSSRS